MTPAAAKTATKVTHLPEGDCSVPRGEALADGQVAPGRVAWSAVMKAMCEPAVIADGGALEASQWFVRVEALAGDVPMWAPLNYRYCQQPANKGPRERNPQG